MVGVLLASRMAFDAYGNTDMAALGIFAAGVALAYGLAGFSNFFLRRPFVSDAVFALVAFATLAAFVIFQFTKQMESMGTVGTVNWNLLPAGILILFALWISGGAGAGVFDAAGHHSDAGGLLGVLFGGADVGLFLLAGGRKDRRRRAVVGFDALHGASELAAFLARRRH